MPELSSKVSFDTLAREWRCKWTQEGLNEIEELFEEYLPKLKGLRVEGAGKVKVQRIVCGACLDFKIITSLPVKDFNTWKETGFVPEKDFLEALERIQGVSTIETQTYTLKEM